MWVGVKDDPMLYLPFTLAFHSRQPLIEILQSLFCNFLPLTLMYGSLLLVANTKHKETYKIGKAKIAKHITPITIKFYKQYAK